MGRLEVEVKERALPMNFELNFHRPESVSGGGWPSLGREAAVGLQETFKQSAGSDRIQNESALTTSPPPTVAMAYQG